MRCDKINQGEIGTKQQTEYETISVRWVCEICLQLGPCENQGKL